MSEKFIKKSYFINTWLGQPLNCLVLLLALLPIFVVGLYVAKYAISVPVNDQWSVSVELAIKTQKGQITFQDLTEQYAEHRIFFTNFVTVIVARVTPWDLKYEAYLSFVLGLANLALLAKLLYDDEPRAMVIVLIPFSMLVFSLRQSLNWTSGFLNCWHFCNFFLLLSLLVLRRGIIEWRSLGLAAFLALCTMYSLGSGLAIWVLLVPTLWMLGYRKWYYYTFWLVIAALSYYTYFLGYDFDRRERLYDVKAIVQFASMYIGNPFVPYYAEEIQPLATMLCGIGVGLWGANFFYLKQVARYDWSRLAVWVTLGTYVVGTAFVTALTRASGGLEMAFIGRYVTLSMLFWVSLVALGAMSAVHILQVSSDVRRWRLLIKLNSIGLVIVAASYIYANYEAIDSKALITFEEQACLVAYPTTHDAACLESLQPSFVNYKRPKRQAYLDTLIAELVAYKLTVFAEYTPGEIMLAYQYNAAAQEAIQVNNMDKALELYERGRELYPDNALIYTGRGELYARLGRTDEAIADLTQAIHLDPLNIQALNRRGALYRSKGMDTEAQRDFLRVLDIDPNNSIAKSQLAQIKPGKKNKKGN